MLAMKNDDNTDFELKKYYHEAQQRAFEYFTSWSRDNLKHSILNNKASSPLDVYCHLTCSKLWGDLKAEP